MSTVLRCAGPVGEELCLVDEEHDARVTLNPQRGGLISRFDLGPHPVLYLDEETLRDPTKNVRGGVPLLFPSPGKLTGDAWAREGHGGALRQHGFARTLPWEVVETSTAAGAAATLRLEASAATRTAWPWDFALEIRYTLCGHVLRLDQRVTNASATPMPFGLGAHPYFHVPQAEKARAIVETDATRAFDAVAGRVVAVAAAPATIDLTRAEVDLRLLDHHADQGVLRWAEGRREVRLRASPEYTHWVVWTLADRHFVCLEPWTCPTDALNTGEQLLTVAPGESRTLFLELTATFAES